MTSGEFPRLAAEAGIQKGEAEAIVANLDRVYGGGETPDEIAFRQAALTHFRDLGQDEEW